MRSSTTNEPEGVEIQIRDSMQRVFSFAPLVSDGWFSHRAAGLSSSGFSDRDTNRQLLLKARKREKRTFTLMGMNSPLVVYATQEWMKSAAREPNEFRLRLSVTVLKSDGDRIPRQEVLITTPWLKWR
jgi:hypothetical protein